jgi:hypothetical protein
VSVEQRLVDALRAADRVEPSTDLWSRVLHSIEEDKAHRRRVVTSVAVTIAMAAGLIVFGLVNLIETPAGRQVRTPAMELIETIALVALVAVLGPAIRRFGRGYADDLWHTTPAVPASLLRLLDVAYLLVFGGYILMTTSFDFGWSLIGVAQQVEDLCWRVGGMVLSMGLLHAATIMTLPVVALVSNSTRVGRSLPRWLVIVLGLVGAVLALFTLRATAGLIIGGIE